jgi:hypothetical protein
MVQSMTLRLALFIAAALVSACNDGGPFLADGGQPAFDVTIGGVEFQANSSAAVLFGNVFTVLLTDQPNACQAYGHIPQQVWTTLTMHLAPSADDSSTANVVPPKPVPGPGQAVGVLVRAIADRPPVASFDMIDGTVVWTGNIDGSVTITAMDVGFAGTPDRLVTGGIIVPSCVPQ